MKLRTKLWIAKSLAFFACGGLTVEATTQWESQGGLFVFFAIITALSGFFVESALDHKGEQEASA